MKKVAILSLAASAVLIWSAVLFAQTEQTQPASQENTEKLNMKMQQALTLLKEKKNTEAEVIFNELLKEYPGNHEVIFWTGVNCIEMNKFEEAHKLADDVLKKDEKNLLMLKLKGRLFITAKEYGDALDVLEEATEYHPNDLEAWIMMTVAAMYDQSWGKAIDAADEALKIDPKNILVLSYKGNAWIAKKKWNKAVEVFDQILAIDPQNEFAKKTKQMAENRIKQEKSGRRAVEAMGEDAPE